MARRRINPDRVAITEPQPEAPQLIYQANLGAVKWEDKTARYMTVRNFATAGSRKRLFSSHS